MDSHSQEMAGMAIWVVKFPKCTCVHLFFPKIDLMFLIRVVQEPLQLAQEFRKFDLTAAWEQFPKFREPAEEEIKIGDETKK